MQTIISEADPAHPDIRVLLEEHVSQMYEISPAESVHVLDYTQLTTPGITFFAAYQMSGAETRSIVGCAAIRELSANSGEIKSMRVATGARRRGVAEALVQYILHTAQQRSYRTLFLETGSQPFFEPARRLYAKHGFVECAPFAEYKIDPNSVFMTRSL